MVLQTLIWIPTRIFFKIFYSYKVEGLENLKNLKSNNYFDNKKGGVIFAVNHSSELDPIMIPASLPFFSRLMPIFYVSREKNFYINSGVKKHIYGGLFFRLWGAHNVFVGLNNFELALKHHIEILKSGKSLCIFPEGKKTPDGNIGRGKGGASFLAQRTNSTIVPVRIKGFHKSCLKRDFLRRKKIEVVFGKPIYPDDLFSNSKIKNFDEYKQATQKIMETIGDL